ncbi:MAG: hypothetical protein KIT84_08745 [Labilithrix sp.]|nr:hypothetical protein [Labilithrix sp.]MCW5811086.1 hypothetical protein [Labilithrix sp.]
MAERRRLPVLQNDPPPSEGTGEDEERPPWHWAGFGVVAIFAAWLPLSFIGGAISQRLTAGVTSEALAQAGDLERAWLMLLIAAPTIVGLPIAAFAGGYIVGRFGTGPGARIGAVSGAVVAIVAALLSRSLLTPLVLVVSLFVVGTIAIGFAALGGRAGAKRR